MRQAAFSHIFGQFVVAADISGHKRRNALRAMADVGIGHYRTPVIPSPVRTLGVGIRIPGPKENGLPRGFQPLAMTRSSRQPAPGCGAHCAPLHRTETGGITMLEIKGKVNTAICKR